MNAKSPKLITLKAGGKKFGLSVFAVRDMLRARTPLPVPLAPAHIPGILNLRGKLTTVIDLSLQQNLQPELPADQRILVVIEHAQEQLALLVDHVVEVTTNTQGLELLDLDQLA